MKSPQAEARGHTPDPGGTSRAESQALRSLSDRAEHIGDAAAQVERAEQGEQLTLFVSEVALHDCCKALKVAIKFCRRGEIVDRGAQSAEEIGHHRMILLETPQHRRQLWVRRLNRGEEHLVFSAMMAVQSDAEPVTIKQQIPCSALARDPGVHGFPGDAKSFSQPLMHAA